MAVIKDGIVIEMSLDGDKVAVGVKRVGDALRGMETTVNQTAASVRRLEAANDSLGTKFRNLVITLGNLRFVAMDINDIFLRLPVAILKSAGEIERLQVLMRGLSKEVTDTARAMEGATNFKFITTMAKNAPFEITALSDAFVKLKTAGVDPTNGSMQALVDSVARFGGTGETMKRASVAIQQMMGKGVISMEELRQQLGEAIPTAMQDMADGMGVSIEKLANIVKTGTLRAKEPIEKMLLQMRLNNEGAAAEMMETWVGMLSRLKTEWSLTASFISENGFGDAAKAAVGELIALLQSDTFNKFAADVGNALGNLTNGLVTTTKFLIENRETIGTLVQAWIAYKVVVSGIRPLAEGVKASYESMGSTMRSYSVQMGIAANAVKAAAAEQIKTDIERVNAAKRASLDAIINKRAETAAIEAENLKVQASYDRLSAAIAAAEIRNRDVRMPGGGTSSQRQAIQDLNDMERALDRNKAALLNNAADIAGHQQAIIASRQEVAKKTADIAKLTTGWTLASAGAATLRGATMALNTAMSFMGGPIGLAITAIMALVWWYNRAASAAEESAERQRRAASGYSNTQDAAAAKAEMLDIKTRLDLARKEAASGMKFTSDGRPEAKTYADQQSDLDAIKKLEDEYKKAQEHYALTIANINEDRVRQVTSSTNLALDRELTNLDTQGKREMRELEKLRQDALNGKKKDSDEWIKINNDYNNRRADKFVESIKRRVDFENKSIKEIEAKAAAAANDQEREGLKRAVDARVKNIEQMEKELAQIQQTRESKVQYAQKSGKLKSKAQAAVDDLEVQEARLRAMIPGILGQLGKIDEVAAAVMAMETRIKNGDFTEKDPTDPNKTIPINDDMKAKLLQMAGNVARLEAIKDDAKLVADRVNQLQPDYEHAIAILANPGGTQTERRINQFDELLSKLKIGKEQMDMLAQSYPQLAQWIEQTRAKVEQGKMQAGTIDMAKIYQATVESNRKAGIEIIKDDRTRLAAQLASEDQLARKREEEQLKNARDAKVSIEEINKLQDAQYEAQMLRAEKARLALRTPMEKLVDDWKNVWKNLEDAQTRWANNFVDTIVNAAETGKFEFSKMATSILKDILRITVQNSVGEDLKKAFKGISDWIGQKITGKTNPYDVLAQNGGADVAEAAKKISTSMGNAGVSTEAATAAMETMTTEGVAATTAAMVQKLGVEGAQQTALIGMTSMVNSASMAIMQMASAAQVASTALATIGGGGGAGGLGGAFNGDWGSMFSSGATDYGMAVDPMDFGAFFADGGIMSSMGSLPLKKYAAGGIANSPQFAVFGEGSMNEAYVPLPDGRSIPVTMSGGGQAAAPSVTVNVINQSGQQVNAQQGQTRMDGKAMILDVVLTAANTPGPFRDGMKGAMK